MSGQKAVIDVEGMAETIFNELGSGFNESIYQKAFEVLLREKGLAYEDQRIVPIYFHSHCVGEGIPDLVIWENGQPVMVIELKSQKGNIVEKDKQQLRNYMRVVNINTGFVVNFPAPGSNEIPEKPEVAEVKLNE